MKWGRAFDIFAVAVALNAVIAVCVLIVWSVMQWL